MDLNHRPLGPEPSARTKLRYTPVNLSGESSEITKEMQGIEEKEKDKLRLDVTPVVYQRGIVLIPSVTQGCNHNKSHAKQAGEEKSFYVQREDSP